MAQILSDLTAEELKKHLTYNPETGLFTRNRNGKIVGVDNGSGYLRVRVGGRYYRCHRLAWLYVYGVWPDGDIDHINRNKVDNRICNLRMTDKSSNMQNRVSQINSKSGIKGVFWNVSRRRWIVLVRTLGKIVHYRSFVFLHDAVFDSIEAYKKYHKCNPYQGESNGTDS